MCYLLFLSDYPQEEREERNEEILQLYLKGFTQEEIAEKFNLNQNRISQIINNYSQTEKVVFDSLQFYNVWINL